MEYKEESSCENDKTTQRNESLEQQKLVLSYLHDLIKIIFQFFNIMTKFIIRINRKSPFF